jgi:hypothetical protein
MQFSASFTSVNGSTQGTIEWAGIDVASSSLIVAGNDVVLSESSGATSFDLEGLTVIEFETDEAPPPVEVDLVYPLELPSWLVSLPSLNLDPFL